MHSSTLSRVALGCALIVAIALPATASATSVGANLRVEATNGKVLADVTQYTSPATVKTDPKARCFGAGSGGSGDRVRVPNPTALGLVADALPHVPALRPLSLTDHFAFGLGVCGIGGRLGGDPDPFWDVFRNHVAAQVGGDQLKVHDGDQILWYLAPSFPVGKELSLRLPLHATPGEAVMASVVAYSDDGTVTPAAGAIVSHASAPTDASGHTSVVLPSAGTFQVQARRGGDIPSNVRVVCTARRSRACGIQKRIYGSPGADRITTTSGNNLVVAGAGSDRITAKLHGGADRIRCGPGRDVVVRNRRDHNERIAASCEKVIRR
jgi:RTX calcium-binding nonapeptide repeat (4 copies)